MAGRKVEFEPSAPGRVSMYVCGPTVYDVPHLGHGRTALAFDMMRRYLEWSGLDVTHVTNVTDVEDRIIARAAAEGSTETDVAERFAAAYWHQIDRLGVRRPDETPYATAFIGPMLELIVELVAGGHAYVIDGDGMGYAVKTYEGFGALRIAGRRSRRCGRHARRRLRTEARPGRLRALEDSETGEPASDSPSSTGRPDWQIECTAMSLQILGEQFNIHRIGDDLVFPASRKQARAGGNRGPPLPHVTRCTGTMVTDAVGRRWRRSLGRRYRDAQPDALDRRTAPHSVSSPRPADTLPMPPTELGPTSSKRLRRSQALGGLDGLLRPATTSRWIRCLQQAARRRGSLQAFPRRDGQRFRHAGRRRGDCCGRCATEHGDGRRRSGGTTSLVAEQIKTLSSVLGLKLDDGAGDDDDTNVDALVCGTLTATRPRASHLAATDQRPRWARLEGGVTLEDTPTGTIWHRWAVE